MYSIFYIIHNTIYSKLYVSYVGGKNLACAPQVFRRLRALRTRDWQVSLSMREIAPFHDFFGLRGLGAKGGF